MALRDFLIAPRDPSGALESAGARDAEVAADAAGPHDADVAADAAGPRDGAAAPRAGDPRPWFRFARRDGEATGTAALAPSLGVLAATRDLPAIAIAAGLIVARRSPAALVCIYSSGSEPPAPPLRAPARPAASRLAASLRARALAAEARGRVALVWLPAAADEAAGATARALAAAGALPTVLAVAARDPDLDVLLAAQDAVLVALAPSVDRNLADLAAAGASRLATRSISVALQLDPVSRALAIAGLRAPVAIREAVEGVPA